MKNYFALFTFLLLAYSFPIFAQKANIQTGADLLIKENLNLLKNKNIGIITNHTAVLNNGIHLVDSLHHIKDINIIALFGPEHGIRGTEPAGKQVDNSIDEATGIPSYSLYGKNKKPTAEMLKDINLLIFDIQDVGARFYTYISTLFYCIQAAAENNIPIIILDRPNPIGGIYVEGPIRKDDVNSFVGIAPIPIAHGMTIGELAKMFAGEKWIGKDLRLDLKIIQLNNWRKKNYFDDYNLPWVSPSPNISDLQTALVYPGTCLVEGINVSEGRGTNAPFLTIGAPYISSDKLISEINKLNLKGVNLSSIKFTPEDIKGKASNPKYKGIECNGISIQIKDRKKFDAVKFGISLVYAINKLYPNDLKFRDGFDLLVGDKKIKEMILKGENPDAITRYWSNELSKFKNLRKKYLLYN